MVKQNASLSAGEKEKQTLANNKEKDKKLKELIGETKYNVYAEVRRTQKEAEALAINTINQ